MEASRCIVEPKETTTWKPWHWTSVAMRSTWWPKDYGQNGEVRSTRLSAGGPVFSIIYGIPFVAVYNGTYILMGGTQNWGPIECANTATASTWNFSALVASPGMVRQKEKTKFHQNVEENGGEEPFKVNCYMTAVMLSAVSVPYSGAISRACR